MSPSRLMPTSYFRCRHALARSSSADHPAPRRSCAIHGTSSTFHPVDLGYGAGERRAPAADDQINARVRSQSARRADARQRHEKVTNTLQSKHKDALGPAGRPA